MIALMGCISPGAYPLVVDKVRFAINFCYKISDFE